MNEKVVVKSELKNIKILCALLPILTVLVYVIWGFKASIRSSCYRFDYGFGFGNGANYILIPLIFAFSILGCIIYYIWSRVELVVTDKRVYGSDALGKRVDLPLDSITAVATSALSGLAVTTASGAIKFIMLKNRDEIHREIGKLLVERQDANENGKKNIVREEQSVSAADELKKFKELLDSGIITQEEFDTKKKQLLGL